MDKFLILPSDDEIKNAIIQAFSLVSTYDDVNILLLLPTKKEMQLQGVIKFFGDLKVKKLINGRIISLNGIPIRLESLRTFDVSDRRNSIIIGIYPSKSMFDKLDDSGADAVIAVPSGMYEDVQEWIDTWNPQIYGKEKKTDEDAFIDNCVVENALKDLSILIERPHLEKIMIRSSHDEGITKGLFKFLYLKKEAFDPISIRRWAVTHDWDHESADMLKEISQKVIEGRIIRGSISMWTAEHLKKWRDGCN